MRPHGFQLMRDATLKGDDSVPFADTCELRSGTRNVVSVTHACAMVGVLVCP